MEVSPNALAQPSSLKTRPDGSGPYTLASVDASLTYYFDRFAGYWDTNHVYPAHMKIITNISDPTAQVDAVRTTGVISVVQPSVLGVVKGDKSLQLHGYPALSPQALFMNSKMPPLDNVNVRMAVSLALNREAFSQADEGDCIPTEQALVPGMVGYVDSLKPTTDVAKAKQLIQAAGATGATIKILTIPDRPFYTWAEVAQSELDAIGLNVLLVSEPPATYRTMYYQGGYGMLQATPTVTSFDPTSIFDQYVVGMANPGTKDPTLVAQIRRAEQLSLGSPQRTAAYQEINKELTNQFFLWAAECTNIYTYGASNKVIGLGSMPYGFGGTPVISYLQVAK
jgi:ABC-type transport system substrate-binding protein